MRFVLFMPWALGILVYLCALYWPILPFENVVFDDLLLVLVLLVVSTASGKKLILRFQIAPESSALVFAAAVGLGSLSILLFLCGLAGGFRPSVFLGILALQGIWSRDILVQGCRWLADREPRPLQHPWIVAGIVASALIMLFLALTPPLQRDELIHHLAYPKLFLERGAIFDLPFTVFSYYPMGQHMLYGLTMGITSDIAPRLLHAAFGILSLFALYQLARRCLDHRMSLLATLLFATLPIVMFTAGKAYVDMGLVFYLISALLAFLHFQTLNQPKWLYLCGMLIGLANGVKYNALLFLPIFLFALLLSNARKSTSRELFQLAFGFLIAAGITMLPFLVRNFVLSGNPLYPLYNGLFGGTPWMPEQPRIPEFLYRVQRHGWPAQFLMPWLFSTEMTGREVYASDGIIGPLLLIFVPWSLIRRRKSTEIVTLGYIALAYFGVAWLISGFRMRYFLPILPILSILAADGVRVLSVRRWQKSVCHMLLVLFIGYNLTFGLNRLRTTDPWPFLTGVLSRDQYLRLHLSDYPHFVFMNRFLPDNARVMMIYTNRGYLLDRAYRYDSYFSGYSLKKILRHADDANAVAEGFRQLGVTHLYINMKGLEADFKHDELGKSPEKLHLLRSFLNSEIKILFADTDAMVAKLEE